MSRTKALAAALLMGAAFSASALSSATRDDAVAMVKKAAAAIHAQGREQTLAEINNSQGEYRVQDLYLSVFGLDLSVYKFDGTALAHGANAKFVGNNMLDLRDAEGKEHIKERMELAKTKSSFWHDFKFVNPVNKKMEPKSMYCERADELVVCGGIYKPV